MGEINKFKKLLEYFVSHLEWCENKDINFIGYEKYIKNLVEKDKFSISGQGYNEDKIQLQIKEWENYSIGKICINVFGRNGYKSKSCYLNWLGTGINICAKWESSNIKSLYLAEYRYWEDITPRVNLKTEYSLFELKLFEEGTSPELETFFEEYKNYFIQFKQMNNIQKALDLLKYKKQIILQGPPGTGKTREAKIIARELIKFHSIENKIITYNTLTQDIIKSNIKEGQRIKGKDDTNYEVISFKKNIIQIKSDKSKVWKPSYNKIIESYNNQLFNEKGRTGGLKSYEDAIAKYLFENLDNKLIESQVETLYKEEDFLQVIQFHLSYSYEDFVRGIVAKPNSNRDGITYEAENKILAKFAENAENDPDNNYVLIIDEINRANLSSVLGELIYALEYRGEAVDSMYEVDGSNKIILPPNLYIIGTMNTADRSVGHIDYAIRRRFAFVDVLPKDLSKNNDIKFEKEKFIEVSKLFIKNFDLDKDYSKEEIKKSDYLSNEFDVKDVWLGHSYFIEQYEKDNNGEDIKDKPIDFRFRLEYEIKPILREYVKDGVLKESASDEIEKL